ncbi:uncharacterized protein isoform X2 [Rhodnius prolixus]|uniref:Uncharacterized protein n=1 Tax=Rhodnius prolixus TaxID=13249 RepID=T1HRC2_RHOPR
MKENILPIGLFLLGFVYLIICSPLVDKRQADEVSEHTNHSLTEENQQSFGNETVPLDCFLYTVENGSYVVTNRTKEELTQDNIPYFELCDEESRLGSKTLSSLTSG